MKKLKVAIIGTGFGQQVHVPVFQHLPDCEVVAIASSNAQKASAVAQKLGIPRAYGNWRELIDSEELDILSIATLPGLQYEIAKAAFQKSLAVFCEKPMALTPAQSQELVTLAQAKGLPQMVDFEFPEIPLWRECLQRLQKGAVGTLERLEVIWSVQTYANRHRTTSWKTNPAEGGGPLFAFASHTLFYLEWFAGPIVSISCKCERSSQDPREVDTRVLLDARFRSGAVAATRIDTDNALHQEHSLSFQGSGGALSLKNTGKDYIQGFQLHARPFASDDFVEIFPASGWDVNFPSSADGRILAVGSLARRLVQWVQGQGATKPDFSAGHRVQQLLSIAEQSHKSGGAWQDVPTL